MVRRIKHYLMVAGCVLALAACSSSGYLTVLDSVAVMSTDKTLGDIAVGMVTGKECYSIRVEQGQSYCVDDGEPARIPVTVHCHQTIGDVTCYDNADPYGQGQRPVEEKPRYQTSARP